MTACCPFCGSYTELASDRRDIPGTDGQSQAPAHRWWLEYRNLDCRARGPRMSTPEAASLAFLQRVAARESIATACPPRVVVSFPAFSSESKGSYVPPRNALPPPRPPSVRPPVLIPCSE